MGEYDAPPPPTTCSCATRPPWSRIEGDEILRWPVIEMAEWDELRQCPVCQRLWLSTWPEEAEGVPILCRPEPPDTDRLRDLDRAATLRAYVLARLEEHVGDLKEEKAPCRHCARKRITGTAFCIEHLVAQRFGKHLAMFDRK